MIELPRQRLKDSDTGVVRSTIRAIDEGASGDCGCDGNFDGERGADLEGREEGQGRGVVAAALKNAPTARGW
jgi:hypothetical protein